MLANFGDEDETLLYRQKTPYQEIKLTRLSDGEIALYLDEAIQFVSGTDDRVYHSILADLPAKMLKGQPGRVLILGGGDGLAARNLLAYPNVTKITMVELDPGMIKFASTEPSMRKLNGDVFRNPKLKVIVGDARAFLEKNPPGPNFEIAIVDFPDPLTPDLEDLFSERLYRQVMAQMNVPRAILSVQTSSAFSDTEEDVCQKLARVTGTKPIPVRFTGKWMVDGTIVLAGRGVVPEMARIPKDWQAEAAPDIVPEHRVSGLF